MTIDPKKVSDIFVSCLYTGEEISKDGDIPPGAISVNGILHKFAFNPQRIEIHRQEVKEFLSQLPVEFHQTSGGGWSFLQACMDRDGNQWGEHVNMDQLFCLGLGLGMVESLLPREMWKELPGGMPYYVIKKNYGEAEPEI